jgi:acetyl-CoA carboxylase biotin carboxyl carrier protein
VELKEIKQIIELMKASQLSKFEIEKEGFRLHIERTDPASQAACGPAAAPSVIYAAEGHPMPYLSHPQVPQIASPAPVVTQEPEVRTQVITSPMVGTFYAAPSPDKPPFVSNGSVVSPLTVVCIIEAMKVMNEIQAELSGTVVEVLVKNGQNVEYGQPLFRVKPDSSS